MGDDVNDILESIGEDGEVAQEAEDFVEEAPELEPAPKPKSKPRSKPKSKPESKPKKVMINISPDPSVQGPQQQFFSVNGRNIVVQLGKWCVIDKFFLPAIESAITTRSVVTGVDPMTHTPVRTNVDTPRFPYQIKPYEDDAG